VAQAERAESPDKLKVVVLDLANGNPMTGATISVKPGIRPSVTETVEGKFTAWAVPKGGDERKAVVGYHFTEGPRRGIAPRPGATAAAAAGAAGPGDGGAAAAHTGQGIAEGPGGAFALDLSTGATSPVAEPPALPRPAIATVPDSHPDIPGPKFLSADGQYILTSKRTGDASTWERYTLTVHDKGTGKPVGAFPCHFAAVPFFVKGSRVVYQTGPYGRRQEGKWVQTPPEVHGVDLKEEGKPWSRPIRETAFRGPFPP
jgi:hypothetical protein